MESTYSIKALQAGTAAVVRRAEQGNVLTITRHEKPVAVIMSHERAAAIAETLEILGDPEAMEAIRADRAGKGRFYTLRDLP
jgi:prevent-host-death family protein